MRVIIIGSGIAGLAAALALQRVGIRATVYERAGELTEVGAGISLWSNALLALNHLGIGDLIRELYLPMECSEFRVANGYSIIGSFQALPIEQRLGRSPFIALIHRADLVGLLAAQLPEGSRHYGFECVGAQTDDSRVVVHFKNGHTDEADLVIGADGIRSALRSNLFKPTEPRYAGYTCWRGICPRPASIPPGYLGEWWGRGQRFGITTLPADRVYWWATKNEKAGGRSDEEKASALASFYEWAEPVPGLIEATPSSSVLRNDIVDRPPTSCWVSGRVVLIGDAAHATTPNLGQGGCMAIEDAVALARCLGRHPELKLGLASFVTERLSRTSAITKDSWWFGRIGQLEQRTLCWLRDMTFGVLLKLLGIGILPKYANYDVGPLHRLESNA